MIDAEDIPKDFVFPPASDRERLLRKLDRRDRALKTFEVVVLVFFVLISTLSIYNHRQQTENLTKQSNQNIKGTEALLCGIVLAQEIPTEGQKEACADKGTKVP